MIYRLYSPPFLICLLFEIFTVPWHDAFSNLQSQWDKQRWDWESCGEVAYSGAHQTFCEIQVLSPDFKKGKSLDKNVTLTMVFSAFSGYVKSTQVVIITLG